MINLGLVGTGTISENALAPAVNEASGVRLWSVRSRKQDRAEDFCKRFSAQSPDPAFSDYSDFLADPELDAVLIATPDKTHAQYGLEAAKSKKHVLMEKPMVASHSEGRRLVDMCDENDLKLGVAYHLRWHRAHRKLIGLIREGKLGELNHMKVRWTYRTEDDSNWRAHKELGRWWSLAAVGTHCLDLIRWIMVPECGEVTEVRSMVANDYWNSPNDETAMVLLKFESGATAELLSSVLFDSDTAVEVYGRKGGVVCSDTLGPSGTGDIVHNGSPLDYEPQNPYEGEISDFARSIEENRSPEVDGREGLKNVDILLEAFPR